MADGYIENSHNQYNWSFYYVVAVPTGAEAFTVTLGQGTEIPWKTPDKSDFSGELYNASGNDITVKLDDSIKTDSSFNDVKKNVLGKYPGVYDDIEDWYYIYANAPGYAYNVYLFVVEKEQLEVPTIIKDLSEEEFLYAVGDTAEALSLEADVTDGGLLTYQWFRSAAGPDAEGNITDGVEIVHATGPSYIPDVSKAGTAYYYAVVTNTKEGVPVIPGTHRICSSDKMR